MAIDPKFFSPYHLSDIAQGATFKNGKRTFRGYGSDTTDRTDNVIYIGSPALQRAVALKAFIDSYKINFTKETDTKKESDKNSHMYAEFTSDLSFDITLNIPAHSTNESRNNTAKLEELQRLIAPLGSINQVNPKFGTKNNYFCVWFKNLIHSGEKYSSYPSPSSITFRQLMQHGFFCYIEGVKYEPDMDAGFFEYDDVTDERKGAFLFPKNIKLSLTLKFGVELKGKKSLNLTAAGVSNARPQYAFSKNGHYSSGDNGRFPFGNLTTTSLNQDFAEVIESPEPDYTTNSMNMIDYRLQGGGSTSNNSFLFISLLVKKDNMKDSTRVDDDSSRKRWIKFKGYINSFSRDHKVNLPTLQNDKNRILGKPIDMDSETTFEALDYSINITVPASDLDEAKRNCAKIQYLMRMFFRKYTPAQRTRVDNSSTNNDKHALRFYSPSFIESPKTTTYYANDFETMYDNSLELYLTNMEIDIDIEAGFFEENGYLWPKVFSLNLQMSYMSGDLITNYASGVDGYSMLTGSAGTYKGSEHLFPFPRQTSKIIIGG